MVCSWKGLRSMLIPLGISSWWGQMKLPSWWTWWCTRPTTLCQWRFSAISWVAKLRGRVSSQQTSHGLAWRCSSISQTMIGGTSLLWAQWRRYPAVATRTLSAFQCQLWKKNSKRWKWSNWLWLGFLDRCWLARPTWKKKMKSKRQKWQRWKRRSSRASRKKWSRDLWKGSTNSTANKSNFDRLALGSCLVLGNVVCVMIYNLGLEKSVWKNDGTHSVFSSFQISSFHFPFPLSNFYISIFKFPGFHFSTFHFHFQIFIFPFSSFQVSIFPLSISTFKFLYVHFQVSRFPFFHFPCLLSIFLFPCSSFQVSIFLVSTFHFHFQISSFPRFYISKFDCSVFFEQCLNFKCFPSLILPFRNHVCFPRYSFKPAARMQNWKHISEQHGNEQKHSIHTNNLQEHVMENQKNTNTKTPPHHHKSTTPPRVTPPHHHKNTATKTKKHALKIICTSLSIRSCNHGNCSAWEVCGMDGGKREGDLQQVEPEGDQR